MIDKIFKAAISHDANDVHLSEGAPPVLRVGGKLLRLQAKALGADDIEQIMRFITPPRCMVDLSKTGNTDFAYDYNEHRFRVTVFRQCGTIGIVMRHFRNVLFTPEDLRIPNEVRQSILHHKGLFLVSGPTGSGKTTTLASLIDLINSTQHKHIITIEDPVEIVHKHKKSLITQREIGSDVASFVDGLYWSMRQDPDVIVVGEIRDLETSRISLKAADTGHLVLGTLHARSVSSAITRIISEFPAGEQAFVRLQFAEALLGIINQVLVPTLDGQAVMSVMEIMVNSPTISSLIRREKESNVPDEIRKGRKLGMVNFEDDLHSLCVSKDINLKEAVFFSRDAEAFKMNMGMK